MRDLHTLDRYRVKLQGHWGDGTMGAFRIPTSQGEMLRVIASAGHEGWDHVSISLADRLPNYGEMCRIHRLFFLDDETSMQLHVPTSMHINNHRYCLHLWRPCIAELPLPPQSMVGIFGITDAEIRGMDDAQRAAFIDDALS